MVLPAGIAPLAARPDEQRVSAVQFACVWLLPIGFSGKPLATARVSTLDFRRTFLCIRKQKSPYILRTFFVWYSRRESNPQRPLRRGLLYPFNYGSILNFNKSAIPATADICRFPQAKLFANVYERSSYACKEFSGAKQLL